MDRSIGIWRCLPTQHGISKKSKESSSTHRSDRKVSAELKNCSATGLLCQKNANSLLGSDESSFLRT